MEHEHPTARAGDTVPRERGEPGKDGDYCEDELGPHQPIGLIPKKGKPGRWRHIVHLSSPDGGSVNDGIDRNLASLKYPTVDHLAMLVRQVGRGAYLVKADVKEPFRNVPIHPDDRWLLGVEWSGVTYVDKVLPFSLRSTPKIFSAIANAVQWILVQRGYPTFSTTWMIL